MSKEACIGIVGFLLVLLPHLGIPAVWKGYLTIGSGSLMLLIGYLLFRERILSQAEVQDGERSTDTFVETTAPLFESK